MKNLLIAGAAAGAVLLGGCAVTSPTSTSPAASPSAETPSNQDDPKPTSGGGSAEEYGYYTCASLRDDLADMSMEQRTDFDALLIAVKNWETLKDIQLDVNYPRNGWLLRCEGTAIWSGEANSRISYGIKKEAGQTFLSYEEIW